MPNLGCSTRVLVAIVVLLLALIVVGSIGGKLVSDFLDITPPWFMQFPELHFDLKAEPVTDPFLNGFSLTNTFLATWLTIIVLVGIAYAATRKMKVVPGRLQGLVEAGLEMLLNFVEGIAGKKNGRRFFPVIATIFLFVITNAYLALLPFFGPSIEAGGVSLFRNANTDINVPLALALMSFFFVEYWGISSLGASHYLGEFINVGQLWEGIKQLFKGKIRPAITGIFLGVINVFMGMIEGLSHLIRIVSFTFRLFGNMTAGEILILVICYLVPWIVVLPFYGLEFLIGFIQALIFAGLTLVFAVLAVGTHGEEQE